MFEGMNEFSEEVGFCYLLIGHCSYSYNSRKVGRPLVWSILMNPTQDLQCQTFVGLFQPGEMKIFYFKEPFRQMGSDGSVTTRANETWLKASHGVPGGLKVNGDVFQ